jgi:hypothetical protein
MKCEKSSAEMYLTTVYSNGAVRDSSMLSEILIAVAAGICQLALTWYAVDISVKENRKRNAVIIGLVGALGIGLTVISTIRNASAQNALESNLKQIRHNTETPPQVTVNPPQVSLNPNIQIVQPPERLHTHVQFLNPDSAPQPNAPTLPFKEDRPVAVNIGFANFGDEVADNCNYGASIHLQRGRANEDAMFKNFVGSTTMYKCQQMMPRSQGTYGYQYHTYTTAALSASDVLQLYRDEAAICATARVLWTDKTGHYRTEYCACLESSYPTFPNSPTMTWHSCTEHNGETKLPQGKRP